MNETFGDWNAEYLSENHQSLQLILNHPGRDNPKHWNNCSLSAHFAADYVANLLSIELANERLSEFKANIAYISNELLENAIKFDRSPSQTVTLGIALLKNIDLPTALIFTKNRIDLDSYEKFKTFIHTLLTTNLDDLYLQQIQQNSTEEEGETSGLGLLTIMNDYSGKLGWKFEAETPARSTFLVVTMAQISI